MKKEYFDNKINNKDNNTKENIIDKDELENIDIMEENTKEETEEVNSTKLNNAPINNSEYENLNDGEYITTKGYTIKKINGAAYIDDILIVNKTYSLPSSFGGELTSEVMNAFNLMNVDAKALGLNLWIQSGYRSYSRQESIYNSYVLNDGQLNADTYSARPGHSEHQTRLAFDLNSIDDSFTYTNEGIWVNNNCYRYGFIIRYPKGKENITGYMHESSHLRYVGTELARKFYNNGDWITLEEYYGITSSY